MSQFYICPAEIILVAIMIYLHFLSFTITEMSHAIETIRHRGQVHGDNWCYGCWWSAYARLQGWGLLSQYPPFRYFPHFPLLSKQTLAVEYHVYIWQVSPQLSCGDTCQIWMWFEESNRYFCKIENFAYGEISERSFSNPHPRVVIASIMNFYPWIYRFCMPRFECTHVSTS